MNTHDIEKSRVTYVQQMENQVQHLRAEHDKYKALADKWEPRVTVVNDVRTNVVSFGLEFGGKRVHANVTPEFLTQMDAAGACTAILDSLVKGLVEAQLRTVLLPEVQRAQQSVNAIVSAGKW
jgi:hypothetical protein